MDKTFVYIYFIPSMKKDKYEFASLKEVFPFITDCKIKSKEFFSKFEDSGYIQFEPFKSSLCGVVGQKIILEDGRIFIRQVDIRFDDKRVNEEPTHLNVYLKTYYPSAEKSQSHHKKLKQCHWLKITEKGIQTLHILLSTQGSAIRRRIVVLPTLRDKRYHKKQELFYKKVKTDALTQIDKNRFEKEFKSYSGYINC